MFFMDIFHERPEIDWATLANFSSSVCPIDFVYKKKTKVERG